MSLNEALTIIKHLRLTLAQNWLVKWKVYLFFSLVYFSHELPKINVFWSENVVVMIIINLQNTLRFTDNFSSDPWS